MTNIEEKLTHKIDTLESRILELELKLEQSLNLQRSHLIRVKNHEEISDDSILSGKMYQDLAPEKAKRLYQNPDFNFLLIDVSARDFKAPHNLPEAIKMPWEDFALHSLKIQSRSLPILIISEDGTNSILACHFLVKRGFYNCNNISGGYKFWKGSVAKQPGLD